MGQAVWDYKFSFILQKTQVSLPKGSHLISDAKKKNPKSLQYQYNPNMIQVQCYDRGNKHSNILL